jgi:uncharacterized protein (DUF2336 family)
MIPASATLLSEFDAVEAWPAERRADTLHRIANLFSRYADSLTAHQIALFDDIFSRLIDGVDTQSLARLSQQLSQVKCASPQSMRKLAFDKNESVALPVLKSRDVAQELLVDVVQSCGPKHRLAIASRHGVDPSVSEALIRHGDAIVHRTLAENLGARLSDGSWAQLVQLGESDQALAEKLARRSDLQGPLKRKIQAKVEDSRMRVLQALPQVMRDKIENTIATTDKNEISGNSEPADYAAALASMVELNRKGKLNDSTVNRFAVCRDYTNVVAALAFLTGSPVEVIQPLIVGNNADGLVLACKASRLNWATATMILKHRPGLAPISAEELEKAKKTFETFSLSAAQRTIRF